MITVFSAPNYCDVYNNKSAIVKIQDGNFNIKQFNYTHHPYMLPKNMDVFVWSLPFVFEKVQDMLEAIIKKCAAVDDDDEDDNDQQHQSAIIDAVNKDKAPIKRKKTSIRNVLTHKIKFLSKVTSLIKQARVKNEQLIQIHGMAPDKLIPDEFIGECQI